MSVNRSVVSTRSGSAPVRDPGEELLDLIRQSIDVFREREVVRAGQLDERGIGDEGRDVSRELCGHDPVAAAVEQQRAGTDPGHDITDVGLHRLPIVVSKGAGPHGVALEPRQLLREALVVGTTRGEDLDAASSFLRVGPDLLEDRVDLFHRHPPGVGVCGGRREQHEGSASLRDARRRAAWR